MLGYKLFMIGLLQFIQKPSFVWFSFLKFLLEFLDMFGTYSMILQITPGKYCHFLMPIINNNKKCIDEYKEYHSDNSIMGRKGSPLLSLQSEPALIILGCSQTIKEKIKGSISASKIQ